MTPEQRARRECDEQGVPFTLPEDMAARVARVLASAMQRDDDDA